MGGLTAGQINILVRAQDQASKVLGRIGGAADKMRKVVRRAGIVGAVALAGLAVAAATTFISFDGAMTKSIAIMGDLDDAMRETMEVTARDVAKTTTFSMTQAADSYFFLASAGLSAEQSIGALPLVARFAQAGMFDMALATDLLTDAQSALGLTVDDTAQNMENMARISDVLVKANTLANATVEQFSTALTREAGAALKSFKIDVEEGVAVLAAFADQGVKGELAGTGLSRILRIMTSAAVSNAEAYARMSVEVFDATGNINNLADIIGDLEGALIGLSDEQRVAALEALGFTARIQGVILPLLGTSEAIREYDSALRDAAGTTAEVAEKQLESLGAQLSLLRSGFEDVLFTIGQEMEPGLRALVATLREDVIPAIEAGLPQALDKVKSVIQELAPVLQQAADDVRAFGGWIIDNRARLVLAIVAIGLAFVWATPGGPLLVGLGLVGGAIVLLRSDVEKLERAALDAKIMLLELTRSLVEVVVTASVLGLNKLPLVGKAFQEVGERGLMLKDTQAKINEELRIAQEQSVALSLGLDRNTVSVLGLNQVMLEEKRRLEDVRQELAATTGAYVTLAEARAFLGQQMGAVRAGQSMTENLIGQWRDFQSWLGTQVARFPSPISAPPPTTWTNDAAAAGEAVGEALAEGIERSLLDMPAVTPERLLELLRFMEAADFTTVGDQLDFLTASAANAARAMEEAARIAAGEFGEALSELARIAGISVEQLGERLGLTNVMEDLGAALRIVAEELGITEAALLAILNPVGEVARGFDVLEANATEGAFAMLDARRGMARYADATREALPAIDDLRGRLVALFGATRDQVEELMRSFPPLAEAMDALTREQTKELTAELMQLGLTAEQITRFFEMLEAEVASASETMEDAATAARSWIEIYSQLPSGMQGAGAAIALVEMRLRQLREDTDNAVGATQEQVEAIGRLEDSLERLENSRTQQRAHARLERMRELAEQAAEALDRLSDSFFRLAEAWRLGEKTLEQVVLRFAEMAGIEAGIRLLNRLQSAGELAADEFARLLDILTDIGGLQRMLAELADPGAAGLIRFRPPLPPLPELLGPGTPAPLLAGGLAGGITQNITIVVENRSPAAIAHAVEMAGLELGEQLVAEGV